MEENKQTAPKTEPSQDNSAAELERVRSRNKILKIATIVFSTLFVLLLAAVIFIYQKISAFKDALMAPTETFQDSAFRGGEAAGRPGELPQAFRGIIASTQNQGGSSLTVFTNAGEYSQETAGVNPEDAQKLTRMMARYADRPIVKDFIAEMKKDPEFAAALKANGSSNPLAMFGTIQKSRNLQGLATKFIMRKDFMPFMMEVMKDPDLQPLLNKMPAGSMGSMSQMMKMLPGASQTGPGSPAPVQAAPQPEESPASGENPGEPAQVDNSAISPAQPSSGTAIKKKTPPPPAD